MEVKQCKKCQKVLPEGYKHSKCESCRGKTIEKIKNAVLTGGGVVVSLGVVVFTGGKIKPKK